MFAGIGSGIVALKRLAIPIKTIIHVEHDHVANHGKKKIYWMLFNSIGNSQDSSFTFLTFLPLYSLQMES